MTLSNPRFAGLAAALLLPWVWPAALPLYPSFPNDALALAGWGLAWLLLLGADLPRGAVPRRPALALTVAALLLALGALLPVWRQGRDAAYAGITAALLLATAAGVNGGARWGSGREGERARLWTWIAATLWVAALANALMAMVQAWAPHWLEGQWWFPPGIVNRAVGLVRQPNHMGMLIVWSLLALAALVGRRSLRPVHALGLAAPLVLGLVLCGSRIATLLLIGFALLGVLPRRSAVLRAFAAGLLAELLLATALTWALAAGTGATAGLVQHAQTGSPSRWPILAHTLHLIATYPLTGTGWGDFNLVWTLTPRDWVSHHLVHHSHNLVLQVLAELGIPLGAAVLLLGGGGLLALLAPAWRADDGDGRRYAAGMVLAVLAHSLVELPLWYAHWLLPTGFFLGLAAAQPAWTSEPVQRLRGLPALGGLMLVGAVFAVGDYFKVMPIYLPGGSTVPLMARLQHGESSLLFRPAVHYAAGVSLPVDLPIYNRAAHWIVDAKLMTQWAKRLEARGHRDAARFILARMRSIDSPETSALVAACAAPTLLDRSACLPPEKPYTPWELVSLR